jgi:hypothetical protein
MLALIPFIGDAEDSPRKNSKPDLHKPLTEYVTPGLHKSITEPACSYVSDQHQKGFVRYDDRVVAWIRGKHNGGAIPLRHFLSLPRVVNDSYGLFFYDADGGYVSAFKKDYGYEFFGWRNGVMVVKSEDGTLWSALSGRAIEGPQKGKRLERIPHLMTDWGHWFILHPKSVAYDMFDGKKYPVAELPANLTANAKRSMGTVDDRLSAEALVLGVEGSGVTVAFPLDEAGERDCFMDKIGEESVAVFWYKPTKSAVAFRARVGDRALTFYADKKAPETAPFKDRETRSRWTVAGRAVEGPLKGSELSWVNSVQCRWFAWAAEYPETELFHP